MRGLLVALAMLSALLGVSGASTLLIERRLDALAPGGVEIARLHYDPLGGRLLLEGVRARDAAGRELFRAQQVIARMSPLQLLARPLTLGQARVTAPRLTLPPAAGFDLAGLAAGLGAAPAEATSLPVRIEDLLVIGGSVVMAGSGAPLVRDLDVRLSRLTTATLDQVDVAFAVEMAAYGTTVYVTGQPRGAGYALHVRARGLDAAALVRDFPMGPVHGLQHGRGELDAELRLAGGRLLASGSVRVDDVVLMLPVPGRPRLRAASLSAVVDNLDLVSGGGRIVRLDLDAPSLSLPTAAAAAAFAALARPLRHHPDDLLIRRVFVSGGTLALEGAGGVRLERVRLTAHTAERRGGGAWTVSAQAGLGPDAQIALEGSLTRDLRRLDAAARMQHVALGPWRALLGDAATRDARVSFDGRLRAAVQDGQTAVTLAGPVLMNRLGVDELVPCDTPTAGGVPLRTMLAAIDDAARTPPAP
jgi:hypothetical protein